eukprot:COSAG02_NODE_34061_length_490_cov_0.800512_1_plen_96_part_10
MFLHGIHLNCGAGCDQVFYPDLIDRSKTPSYSLHPVEGNPDQVQIRFKAGPPYEVKTCSWPKPRGCTVVSQKRASVRRTSHDAPTQSIGAGSIGGA